MKKILLIALCIIVLILPTLAFWIRFNVLQQHQTVQREKVCATLTQSAVGSAPYNNCIILLDGDVPGVSAEQKLTIQLDYYCIHTEPARTLKGSKAYNECIKKNRPVFEEWADMRKNPLSLHTYLRLIANVLSLGNSHDSNEQTR